MKPWHIMTTPQSFANLWRQLAGFDLPLDFGQEPSTELEKVVAAVEVLSDPTMANEGK